MADLGIIFLRRKHTIHWYQSLFTIITGSMPFRYFWATLYSGNLTRIIRIRTDSIIYEIKTVRPLFLTCANLRAAPRYTELNTTENSN